MIRHIETDQTGISMELADNRHFRFDYYWLRDHATDPRSYDARTHQRELFTALIEENIKPVAVRVTDDGTVLEITWPDATGAALYPLAFLLQYGEPAAVSPAGDLRRPWGRAVRPGAVRMTFEEAQTHSLDCLIEPIRADGFLLIQRCPPDTESVQTIADRLGGVQTTLFGDLWRFSASEQMQDSAYSARQLRPHTDGTYSHDAPGLQLLLCCRYAASGAESLLVDGCEIFSIMNRASPELAEVLQQVEVPGQYIGDGRHLLASRPVFRCDRQGRLLQVSFNNYDRAPFRLPDTDMKRFYQALREFERLANSAEQQWHCTLNEGDLLIFDNWRLLHGRGAYTGEREMAGCYISRGDFDSACRLSAETRTS